MVQWQGYALVTSKTWVQVPGLAYFVYYFVITVPMQRDHHHAPCASIIQPATCIPTLDQRPKFKVYHTLPVNASYWIQKVNELWIALGLKLPGLNLHLGTTPPLVCFLFLFISSFDYFIFLLFKLINLFSFIKYKNIQKSEKIKKCNIYLL